MYWLESRSNPLLEVCGALDSGTDCLSFHFISVLQSGIFHSEAAASNGVLDWEDMGAFIENVVKQRTLHHAAAKTLEGFHPR